MIDLNVVALAEVVALIENLSPMCQHYKDTMNKLNEWMHKHSEVIARAKLSLHTEEQQDEAHDDV
jgi:hypothetical protein